MALLRKAALAWQDGALAVGGSKDLPVLAIPPCPCPGVLVPGLGCTGWVLTDFHVWGDDEAPS